MKGVEQLREKPSITLERTLELLLRLKNDYSDEIPDEIITTAEHTHKCQINWFQGVMDLINLVQQYLEFYGEIEPDEINAFLKKFTSDAFKKQDLTKREDVDEANVILDKMISIVQQMLKRA